MTHIETYIGKLHVGTSWMILDSDKTLEMNGHTFHNIYAHLDTRNEWYITYQYGNTSWMVYAGIVGMTSAIYMMFRFANEH